MSAIFPGYGAVPVTYGNVCISNGGSGGTYSADNIWNTATADIRPSSIQINGDAVFEGNITWQGRDMREWFESVERRLAILQPNVRLEAEYEELAQLRQQYVELERKLLEKQQVFDILKNS